MEETEILTMETTKARKNNLPPPFGKIEYKTEGKVLGKQIHMNNNKQTSIKHRLHKARQRWQKQENIPQNPTLYGKNKNHVTECNHTNNTNICIAHADI